MGINLALLCVLIMLEAIQMSDSCAVALLQVLAHHKTNGVYLKNPDNPYSPLRGYPLPLAKREDGTPYPNGRRRHPTLLQVDVPGVHVMKYFDPLLNVYTYTTTDSQRTEGYIEPSQPMRHLLVQLLRQWGKIPGTIWLDREVCWFQVAVQSCSCCCSNCRLPQNPVGVLLTLALCAHC
jgi:hypothetical protein